MATRRTGTVVGVFNDRKQANDAVDALKRAGFRDDQIGVAGKYLEGETTEAETGSKWEEGAVAGFLGGAGLGALVGLGVLAGMIPVVGPVIAGGTLAVIAANAAGGAAIVGIVGALVGAGIPEEEAQYYENEVRSGRTLVTVQADGRAAEATEILRRFNAYDMHTATASATSAAATGQTCAPGAMAAAPKTAARGDTIEVREERLHAEKTPVETGGVRVRKEVVTEHRSIDVPVQREEVVVERHPVGNRPASEAEIRSGEEIRIPVREEQVKVGKEAVVTEEVSVGKRTVSDTEHVSGDVRKEKVKIEREGEVDVRGRKDTSGPGKTR